MQKKVKNLLVLGIIAVSFMCSITVITQVNSYTRTNMDYVYFYIYKIDIIDDFNGKGTGAVSMDISFGYERILGTYGDRLYNGDGQYEDFSDDFNYLHSFSKDDEGELVTDETYDPSYCLRIDDAGNEYRVKIKVDRSWATSETETIYLGTSISYDYYYWTSLIYFDDYDGVVKLYYKILT